MSANQRAKLSLKKTAKPSTVLEQLLAKPKNNVQPAGTSVSATQQQESQIQQQPPAQSPVVLIADKDVEDEFNRLFENVTLATLPATSPLQPPPPSQPGDKNLALIRREEKRSSTININTCNELGRISQLRCGVVACVVGKIHTKYWDARKANCPIAKVQYKKCSKIRRQKTSILEKEQTLKKH
ncbi:hypothetical protein PPYR_01353 [Photinus pyralis]|uniref:Uncharacterized protein n=1 Tax=Photinus pyralis TaxID=7054 RepID=A0A5N4B4A7_PHOPY|nr:uncharacterized protein LOC116174635 [Photinus pyralis]KAB0804383.1 hypothetical protein PPYR_01353 [Photinus pyralis]